MIDRPTAGRERSALVRYLPGLGLIALLAMVARGMTAFLPSIISEVTVALVLGLILANVVSLPAATKPGIKFAVRSLLRVGIVLLGARLSFQDVLATGLNSLLIVLIGMGVALLFTLGIGRLLRLPSRLCLLIGVGTAVCGNTAIIATAPSIEAEEEDVSFAVATITLLGTVAVLLYPMIGHAAGFSDQFFGYWAGTAVNDTSQVVATGFAYSEAAGDTATVVKLIRNTLMGPLLMIIGMSYLRIQGRDGGAAAGPRRRLRLLQVVPLFVVGFLAMALLNTVGAIPAEMGGHLNDLGKTLILCALAGVGLSTNLAQMRRVGPKPFYLGVAATTVLSVTALGLISLLIDA